MLRPSNSATSLGSMDSKGDASTGSEGLYDWTAPRFGGLSVASEPKPELTLADGARFPEFRPDDGSLFAAASPDARRRRPAGAASSPGAQQRAIGRPAAAAPAPAARSARSLVGPLVNEFADAVAREIGERVRGDAGRRGRLRPARAVPCGRSDLPAVRGAREGCGDATTETRSRRWRTRSRRSSPPAPPHKSNFATNDARRGVAGALATARRGRRAPPSCARGPAAVWKSNSASGAPDNSSLSHISAMTRPCWLLRAVRNRHRHAIEQASRRWRGGRRDDSARTRRKILISTQAGSAPSRARWRNWTASGAATSRT